MPRWRSSTASAARSRRRARGISSAGCWAPARSGSRSGSLAIRSACRRRSCWRASDRRCARGAFAVPGALGVQEGGYVMLGRVVGLGPETALALSLAKRVRELVLGVPGLIAWQLDAAASVIESAARGAAGMSALARRVTQRGRVIQRAGLPLVRLEDELFRGSAPANRPRRLRRSALPRAAAAAHRRLRRRGEAHPTRSHRGATRTSFACLETGYACSGNAGATPGSRCSR